MKHDSLQYKTSFYAAGCTLSENGEVMQLGYIFVDMIKSAELFVMSGTGETYRIRIPSDIRNIPSSHQFNYAVEVVK